MDTEISEKERDILNYTEEEKEVKDEKSVVKEEMSEEQEIEELRAQMLQLFIELEEARDLSQKHEETFLELQGLLEDERLASAHQAEAFTRQIQRLQAQLRSVQEEMNSLEEEKESELQEAREELQEAREEVLILQQAAEEAAAERENDIACLQEELCRLRAEISRLENTGQEYELEIVTLRAEIEMKSKFRQQQRREGDMGELRDECNNLKEQCLSLQDENTRLTNRVQLLQKRSSSGAYLTLKEEQEETEEAKDMECGTETDAGGSYININQMSSHCRLVDAGIQKNISFEGKPVTPTSWTGGFSEILSLRDQLKQTEEKAANMQREYDGLKTELKKLGEVYESSQRERAELELELLRCREELERPADGQQE
ncbi:sarcolemmal membrane-associated protein isoform X1 [Misgurnus anguillicaudatus]|uniref:sarcolemmal membrane-associated protein isoform X1 n=1 Tax=Misgurnus anguillicaudatus TaxID=75329 RepID=UPI00243521DE|nr:coiled-coil domain-containing protein 136 isoform X1 [Misgurnus anguillicaudatus]XP_055047587.1 coiled-coil domain-containing protein 136 isoform X1 [Misgurnus anguillicaudatus]XP_055047590.1 coiled-coil domain-containing protein 136 isoform X1 [Misgurnus anguillicaudatus]